MNHDPLCRTAPCQCALITRVRKDEQALHRLSKPCREQIAKAYVNGYREGREEAAKAVKALAGDWPPHHTDYVVRTALARAAMVAEGKLNAVSAS